MHKLDVAGLKIDSLSKQELFNQLTMRLQADQPTFITTPYSEFLYRSLRDPKLLEILNQADFAVPDGIGIFWAAKFLSLPLTAKSYYGKILQAWWQAKYSLAAILFYPKFIREMFKEKISGSDLIWDLTKLAVKEHQKIFLLGGFGNTPKLVADRLKALGAQVEWSNKNPDDESVIEDIKKADPDFLFVTYGPIRQEQWIVENRHKLACKLYIGLGGTFDYVAQKQPNPPRFMRFMGLEWLFRLFTQPKRAKRIWQATFGLIMALVRYKVFSSLPYRKNVVSMIINKENKILIAKRNKYDKYLKDIGELDKEKFRNYWQFCQGGIDGSENVETAARRELREELNITHADYIKTSGQTNTYGRRQALRPLLMNGSKFRGQTQKIVYFRFTGDDNEIKPDQEEFTDYKWVLLNELAHSVHEERKPLALIAQQDLKDLA